MHPTLDGLDDIPWDELEDAYGPATAIPDHLRALASDSEEERNEAFSTLTITIYHQGSIYSAAVEAAPFLVRMVDTDGFPNKPLVLELLSYLATGWSWHDSHKDFIVTRAMRNNPSYEYDAKIERELVWVRDLRAQIAAGIPVFLKLLGAPDAETRTATCQLLFAMETSESIRAGALTAFAQETDSVCRATMLLLAGRHELKTRDLWEDGLAAEPDRLVRLIAAAGVLHQERAASPRAAADLVLAELRVQDATLRKNFEQIPNLGNFVAALGGFLTFVPEYAERALQLVVADVEARPDVMGDRLRAMLALCCSHTDPPTDVFANPTELSELARRALAAAFRSAIKVTVIGGNRNETINGNAFEVIQQFGIPIGDGPRDEYLAAAGVRPWD